MEAINTVRRLLLVTALVVTTAAFTAVAHPQKSDWKPLFNGKDLSGWKHVGPGGDTVEDGLIKTHGGMGLLYWTGGKVSNCHIGVVFKIRDTNDNPGVSIRIPLHQRED